MYALNIPIPFYQKNVLKRAQRQHNPVHTALSSLYWLWQREQAKPL